MSIIKFTFWILKKCKCCYSEGLGAKCFDKVCFMKLFCNDLVDFRFWLLYDVLLLRCLTLLPHYQPCIEQCPWTQDFWQNYGCVEKKKKRCLQLIQMEWISAHVYPKSGFMVIPRRQEKDVLMEGGRALRAVMIVTTEVKGCNCSDYVFLNDCWWWCV